MHPFLDGIDSALHNFLLMGACEECEPQANSTETVAHTLRDLDRAADRGWHFVLGPTGQLALVPPVMQNVGRAASAPTLSPRPGSADRGKWDTLWDAMDHGVPRAD